MKFVLTLALAASVLAISTPASAAPVTPTGSDITAAHQAATAAERTVAKFHRAGGVSYRSDPIGARIAAAKPVRLVKPKPAITLASAFTPAFMASLKKR